MLSSAYFKGSATAVIVLVFCVLKSQSVSVWKDVTLTEEEKYALEKFKIITNKTLPHEYMRTDIFLIKWLRAQNLDIRNAERMLRQNLVWRKQNRMDYIEDEDFGSMVYEYPYSTDGIDYEGRPVLAMDVSEWDIRQAVITGRVEKLARWAFRAYEIGARKIRQLQAEGQNVTQFQMVCNFDGYNMIQHSCLQCIEVLVNFLSVYEQNFPGMADSIIGIKTPQAFQILLRALTTVMSKETQGAVQLWGPNKNEWRKNILKLIPADQLDEPFGGTRNSWVDR